MLRSFDLWDFISMLVQLDAEHLKSISMETSCNLDLLDLHFLDLEETLKILLRCALFCECPT